MPGLPVGLTSEESWRSSAGVKIHLSRQYEVPPWGVRPRGNQEACLLGQFPGCELPGEGCCFWVFPMGHFLQTRRLSTSIDPRRGEEISKHSAPTSLFSPVPHASSAPSLWAPRCSSESTTCRHPSPWHSGARRPSGEGEVSSGLPLPSPRPKRCSFPPPSGEGEEGSVLPGVVSPWPGARGHLPLDSPALVSAAPAGSEKSAQKQWSHSRSLGFAQ